MTELQKRPAAAFDEPRQAVVIATHATRWKQWKVYADGVVQRLEGRTCYEWTPPDLQKFLRLHSHFTQI